MRATQTDKPADPRTLATIAARLALDPTGRNKTLREILSDAERLRRAALDARAALASNRSAIAIYNRAQRVAERYGAIVFAPACGPERPLVLLFCFGDWGVGSEFSVVDFPERRGAKILQS